MHAEPWNPAAHAAALKKAAIAARAAGASEVTAEAPAAEAEKANKEAVSCKPLGARIDSARARLRHADARLASSRNAVAKAQAQQAEAFAQVDSTGLDGPSSRTLRELAYIADGIRAPAQLAVVPLTTWLDDTISKRGEHP